MNITPTERLTFVIAEASAVASANYAMREALINIVRDWGAVPAEVTLQELREILDSTNLPPLRAIPSATAYLRTNADRLMNARNFQRKSRGLAPSRFDPRDFLPAIDKPMTEPFDLSKIEKLLEGLSDD